MLIESTIFCYHMAFTITSIIENLFFIFQACHNDLEFKKEICLKLEEYPDERLLTHNLVSSYQNYSAIINKTVSFVMALSSIYFLKNIDKKLCITIGLIGKIIYSFMVVSNSFFKFKLYTMLYSAILPCALTGSDIIIMSNTFAYLSENVKKNRREFRMTALNAIILTSMPIGIIISEFLFKHVELFKDSFVNMFLLNCSLLLVSIFLSLFLNKDKKEKEKRYIDIENIILPPQSKINRIVKNYKIEKYLLMFISGLHILQREEKIYLYMFTQEKLDWTFHIFSNFKFLQTLLFAIISIFVSIVLKKIKINNYILILLGSLANIIARIFYMTANIYIGGILTSLGPLVESSIRSQISKIVPSKYLRSVFIVTISIETFLTFIVSFLFNIFYTYLPHLYIFTITLGTQLIISFIALIL